MIIGIDIDDTITNSSEVFIKYAKKFNKENNIKHKINTKEFDQNKAFGWDSNLQNSFSQKYLKTILEEAKPKKNVKKVINMLKNDKASIILISARSDLEINGMKDITKNWLKKYDIRYDSCFINCTDKTSICLENDINIFIDDNFNNCKKVSDILKIPVFLYDSNYNKSFYDNRIIRVFNWKQIYCYVKNLNSGEVINENRKQKEGIKVYRCR